MAINKALESSDDIKNILKYEMKRFSQSSDLENLMKIMKAHVK
jgi:hypothetical protein